MQQFDKGPEWIARLKSEKVPRSMRFEELFLKRDEFEDLVILWNYNSYRIDCHKKEFIINGGRRVQLASWKHYKNGRIRYARRVHKQININSKEGTFAVVTFLIGMAYYEGAEKKDEIYLQISEDGTRWRWLDTR